MSTMALLVDCGADGAIGVYNAGARELEAPRGPQRGPSPGASERPLPHRPPPTPTTPPPPGGIIVAFAGAPNTTVRPRV